MQINDSNNEGRVIKYRDCIYKPNGIFSDNVLSENSDVL